MSRIYKGSDKVIRIPKPGIEISAYEDVQIFFYTDGDNVVKKEMVDVDIDEHDITVKLYDRDTNAFNEGVLRYTIKVKLSNDKFDDGYDTATDVQTDYFIKASAISGETVPIVPDVPTGDCSEVVEELNNEKEQLEIALNGAMTQLEERDTIIAEKDATIAEKDAAIEERDTAIAEKDVEIAEKDATITEKDAVIAEKDRLLELTDGEAERAYENGYNNGIAEQKGKLTSTTIRNNGTYTREDGWNEVNIQIPTEDARILDLTVNLQQMMVNNSNYKYSSFFLFGNNAELNISSSQDVVIIDYEGNCTRYIGQSVTHRCTSYYNMVYVFSNSTAGLSTTYVAKYGCVYSDNITRYDRLPRADKLDMYFTPECEIVGAVAGLKTEIKFHTKDKPNINTIVYPNNLFLYFPTGTDLEDLKNQYPTVTIITY